MTVAELEALDLPEDCAWCGAEVEAPFPNRAEEVFCSRYHREASNAAVRRLQARDEEGEPT